MDIMGRPLGLSRLRGGFHFGDSAVTTVARGLKGQQRRRIVQAATLKENPLTRVEGPSQRQGLVVLKALAWAPVVLCITGGLTAADARRKPEPVVEVEPVQEKDVMQQIQDLTTRVSVEGGRLLQEGYQAAAHHGRVAMATSGEALSGGVRYVDQQLITAYDLSPEVVKTQLQRVKGALPQEAQQQLVYPEVRVLVALWSLYLLCLVGSLLKKIVTAGGTKSTVQEEVPVAPMSGSGPAAPPSTAESAPGAMGVQSTEEKGNPSKLSSPHSQVSDLKPSVPDPVAVPGTSRVPPLRGVPTQLATSSASGVLPTFTTLTAKKAKAGEVNQLAQPLTSHLEPVQASSKEVEAASSTPEAASHTPSTSTTKKATGTQATAPASITNKPTSTQAISPVTPGGPTSPREDTHTGPPSPPVRIRRRSQRIPNLAKDFNKGAATPALLLLGLASVVVDVLTPVGRGVVAPVLEELGEGVKGGPTSRGSGGTLISSTLPGAGRVMWSGTSDRGPAEYVKGPRQPPLMQPPGEHVGANGRVSVQLTGVPSAPQKEGVLL